MIYSDLLTVVKSSKLEEKECHFMSMTQITILGLFLSNTFKYAGTRCMAALVSTIVVAM